jgi:hypothetical protein
MASRMREAAGWYEREQFLWHQRFETKWTESELKGTRSSTVCALWAQEGWVLRRLAIFGSIARKNI